MAKKAERVSSNGTQAAEERVDRRRVGPATKAMLERVAAQQFDVVGFQSVTMKSIASECGLTPSAFYNHFPSKQDVLFSIICSAYDRLGEAVEDALAVAGTKPVDRLHAAIRAMSGWLLKHPSEARVSRREIHELDEARRHEMTGRWRSFRRNIEKIIVDGIAEGQIPVRDFHSYDMPKVLATVIVSMAESLPETFPAGEIDMDHEDNKATELLVWLTDRLLSQGDLGKGVTLTGTAMRQ